jgi:hypothetical protein
MFVGDEHAGHSAAAELAVDSVATGQRLLDARSEIHEGGVAWGVDRRQLYGLVVRLATTRLSQIDAVMSYAPVQLPVSIPILPPYLVPIIEDSVRKKAVEFTQPDCGLSAALRFSVKLEDGTRVFVKAATDEDTTRWLSTEHLVLSTTVTELMPSIVAWIEPRDTWPVLITEDLSHAYWPASHAGVTWRDGDFDLLFAGIEELSSLPANPALRALVNRRTPVWSAIAAKPESFLQLGLCSDRWFGNAIDVLADAERNTDLTGDIFIHGDIRSDNTCVLGSQVKFVDWSHAARGSSTYNLAQVLPTLHLEGGPVPYDIMPNGGGHAALMGADMIRRLGMDQGMPGWLKDVFKRIIAIELEWAASCLALPKPDGTLATSH